MDIKTIAARAQVILQETYPSGEKLDRETLAVRIASTEAALTAMVKAYGTGAFNTRQQARAIAAARKLLGA